MNTITKILFSITILLVWSLKTDAQNFQFNDFQSSKNLRAKCNMAFILSDYYFAQSADSVDFVIEELIKFQDDEVYSERVKSTILFIDGKNAVTNLGDLNLARRKLFAARNYFLSQQESENVVQCNMNIGNAYFNEGKFEKAISYYQRALNLAVNLDGSPEYMESLFSIGRSYVELGDTIRGLDFIKEYSDVTIQNNFPRSFAKALAYRAMIHFDAGDKELAGKLYAQSAEVALQSNFKEEYAEGLTNQAIYFYLMNQLDSSQLYFENALLVREGVGAIKPIIESNFNLGSFFYGKEDYKNALVYFSESKRLSKENGFWLDEKDANEELIGLNEKYPLSNELNAKIQKDQKRLENQVSSSEKVHSDLDRQMEYWLGNGLESSMEGQIFKDRLPNWVPFTALLLIISFGLVFLKRNWG